MLFQCLHMHMLMHIRHTEYALPHYLVIVNQPETCIAYVYLIT